MARNRHVANDMALDKLALPAISDADVLDVLRMWEFQSKKDLCVVFCSIIVNNLRASKPPQSLPRNVSLYAIQKNTLQAQSDILGIAISAAGRVAVTAATLQHPAVFGLFARWLEDNMPPTFAQPFPFTTITMTHGHRPPFQFFWLVIMSV